MGANGGGAGVYVNNGADLTLVNVTLTANFALDRGGALYVEDHADVHLTNVTIVGNAAPLGGAIMNHGHVDPVNTIIGANGPAFDFPACSGDALQGDGPNLVADPELRHGQYHRHAPIWGLTAQTDDGGVTFWMLTETSPALDAGSDDACPATDQFGSARPQRAHCDIGAHELEAAEHPPTAVGHRRDHRRRYAGHGHALRLRPGRRRADLYHRPAARQRYVGTGHAGDTDTAATTRYTPPANFTAIPRSPTPSATRRALCDEATAHVTVTPDATLEVTTVADSGPGSLRDMLNQANADPDTQLHRL